MEESADDVFLVKIMQSGEIERVDAAERALASLLD